MITNDIYEKISETHENELIENNEITEETSEYSKISEIAENVNQIMEQIQVFSHFEQRNRELHTELQKHQSGLKKELLTPILKKVIREYDRVTQQFEYYGKKVDYESQNEFFTELLNEFKIVALCLLDLLEDYDVTSFDAKAGDDYSQTEHKIINIIDTEDETLNKKIANCLSCGFRDIETGRLLRQAEVNIYKFLN